MSNKPVRLNSGKRTRRKSAFIYDVATIFLTILIAAALFPVSALASEDGVEAQSGWQALEAYALEKTDNPDIVDDIEAGKAAYGRELTAEEVEIWKKGFDARAAAEAAMDENRALTAAEEETIKQAAIAAFGSPEDRKVKSEQAMREKYPAPPPTQIIDLPKVTEKASKNVKSTVQEVKPSTFATQMTPLDMQQIMPETKEVPVEAQVLSAGADAQYTTAWVHQRTPGVGVYPTQKGKVLVTADLFTNGVTFGHAGIVYDGGRVSRWGVIEAFGYLFDSGGGVVSGYNDFDSRYDTCFGLDVSSTNSTQEAAVADWCKFQIGKPFNWNFLNPWTYDSFYCSQLVWRGYHDITGVNIDTNRIANAVEPGELVQSPYTATVYRHGNYSASSWDNINGKWYFFDGSGNYLRSGMYNVAGQNYFFAPTGELVSYYCTAVVSSAMGGNKALDVPNASTVIGTQLIIWDWNYGNHQIWDIFSPDGSTFVLQSRHSKKVVDIFGGIPGNEVPVVQWDYHGGANQRWQLVRYSDGSYQFRSAYNTGYVLDVSKASATNGAKMIVWPNSGAANQRWFF